MRRLKAEMTENIAEQTFMGSASEEESKIEVPDITPKQVEDVHVLRNKIVNAELKE